MTGEQSGDYAEDLAASMLASTLGVDFDPDAAWNERKRVYETSHLIIVVYPRPPPPKEI